MKGCIYLFITRNVYRSWVLVPDMAILKGKLGIFPFPAFACQVLAAPKSAVTRPAGDASCAGDKLQAELPPAKQDCPGLG